MINVGINTFLYITADISSTKDSWQAAKIDLYCFSIDISPIHLKLQN